MDGQKTTTDYFDLYVTHIDQKIEMEIGWALCPDEW